MCGCHRRHEDINQVSVCQLVLQFFQWLAVVLCKAAFMQCWLVPQQDHLKPMQFGLLVAVLDSTDGDAVGTCIVVHESTIRYHVGIIRSLIMGRPEGTTGKWQVQSLQAGDNLLRLRWFAPHHVHICTYISQRISQCSMQKYNLLEVSNAAGQFTRVTQDYADGCGRPKIW